MPVVPVAFWPDQSFILFASKLITLSLDWDKIKTMINDHCVEPLDFWQESARHFRLLASRHLWQQSIGQNMRGCSLSRWLVLVGCAWHIPDRILRVVLCLMTWMLEIHWERRQLLDAIMLLIVRRAVKTSAESSMGDAAFQNLICWVTWAWKQSFIVIVGYPCGCMVLSWAPKSVGFWFLPGCAAALADGLRVPNSSVCCLRGPQSLQPGAHHQGIHPQSLRGGFLSWLLALSRETCD